MFSFFFFHAADLFQKLPLGEHPLLLRLIAGPDPERLSFVLKENETGEVEVRNHTHLHTHTHNCGLNISTHFTLSCFNCWQMGLCANFPGII